MVRMLGVVNLFLKLFFGAIWGDSGVGCAGDGVQERFLCEISGLRLSTQALHRGGA